MKNIFFSITFATIGLGCSLGLIVQSSAQASNFDFSFDDDINSVIETIYELNDDTLSNATSVTVSSSMERIGPIDLDISPFTNEFTGASESVQSYNYRLSSLLRTLYAMLISKQYFMVL